MVKSLRGNAEELSTVHTTLNRLFKKAQKIQFECQDYSVSQVNGVNMWYESGMQLGFIPDVEFDEPVSSFDLTPWALSQLCTKLGIPTKYLLRCIESDFEELVSDNINSWLEVCKKDLFVRTYKDSVRGILSDRYAVLDTPDILDVISDSFNLKDYRIAGHLITPERFHLRLVKNDLMPIKGEDLFGGIQIDSSDVGKNVLSVDYFVYKQICTNGMWGWGNNELFSQRHIGIKPDIFRNDLVAALKNVVELEDQAIKLIKKAKSQTLNVPDDLEESKVEIKAMTSLPDNAVEKVINIMDEKYDRSYFGYINAITEVAQDYTLDRRLEIEKVAGMLLAKAV